MHLTPEQASDFYAEHNGKSFYSSIIAFMGRSATCSMCLYVVLTTHNSGPIVVAILAKEHAVEDWRTFIGPTDSAKARTIAPDR